MSLLLNIDKCPECMAAVSVSHKLKERMGFTQYFYITCNDCPWTMKFCYLKQRNKLEPRGGRAAFDVNRRMVISFRGSGLGYAGLKSFCRCMNMPP